MIINMKYSLEQLDRLKLIIENSKNILESKNIMKLNETFNKFASSFNYFFTILCSEKIINIDPYGEEHDLKTLNIPARSPVDYNEENYIISIRLTHYSFLLNFIKDEGIIALNQLTRKKISKIEAIVKFIDWDRVFDPQPLEINTEALNKVLFNYQKDRGQKYIISSLKTSIEDIFNYSKDFVAELEPVKLYINESYKLFIRKEILNLVKLPPELQGTNIKKAHDLISNKVRELAKPLYIELVGEVLKEDFSSDGEEIKIKIINLLEHVGDDAIKPQMKEDQKIKIPLELLKKSIMELSKSSSQFDTIIEKCNKNSDMFKDETFTIFDKISYFIKYHIFKSNKNTIYTLEISNNSNEKPKNKVIEFEKFIISTKSLKKILENYKDCDSDTYKKQFDKEEEEIKITIRQILSKCRYIYKILSGMDHFFKNKLNSSKGIQVELKALLFSFNKAQNTYFEYKQLKNNDKEKTTYKHNIDLTT